jgi:hypothetical protein
MTQRHPDASASVFDERFSDSSASIRAAQSNPGEESLRESTWFILKEWAADLHRVNQAARPMTGAELRQALYNSRKNDFRHVKQVLVRKNWPSILNEVGRWCESNRNLLD